MDFGLENNPYHSYQQERTACGEVVLLKHWCSQSSSRDSLITVGHIPHQVYVIKESNGDGIHFLATMESMIHKYRISPKIRIYTVTKLSWRVCDSLCSGQHICELQSSQQTCCQIIQRATNCSWLERVSWHWLETIVSSFFFFLVFVLVSDFADYVIRFFCYILDSTLIHCCWHLHVTSAYGTGPYLLCNRVLNICTFTNKALFSSHRMTATKTQFYRFV